MNEDIGYELKEFRYGIGAEILINMEKNDDLPLPNKKRVAKVMHEYFKQDGYIDILAETGYRWKSSVGYWMNHLDEVRRVLRDTYNKVFEFIPKDDQKGFAGDWKFVSKHEFGTKLRREYSDVGTRTETYNERLEGVKWDMQLPHIADVPLLN